MPPASALRHAMRSDRPSHSVIAQCLRFSFALGLATFLAAAQAPAQELDPVDGSSGATELVKPKPRSSASRAAETEAPADETPRKGEPTWAVDRDASVFAVVTHKAGIGQGLAHEHLVIAAGYTAELRFDPDAPTDATFQLEAPSAELTVDDPDAKARWQARLLELSIPTEPFAEVSEKDRKKIHKSMTSNEQLDVENHETLSARVVRIREATPEDADGRGPSAAQDFPFVADLAFTVRGTTHERPVRARWSLGDDGRLTVEAVGSFHFSDFGIEPYSAMLGAIRNDDPFHVYVHLVADPG